MKFFDAHCDTVLKALYEGLDFVGGGGAHIDLPRLAAAGSCVQLFAVFMAEGVRPSDGDMEGHTERALATIHGWANESGGRLRLALTAADVGAACGLAPERTLPGRLSGAHLGLQGDPLVSNVPPKSGSKGGITVEPSLGDALGPVSASEDVPRAAAVTPYARPIYAVLGLEGADCLRGPG